MKILKICISSILIGVLVSSFVNSAITTQYIPDSVRLNDCLEEYGLEQSEAKYRIIKSGYPFYLYTLDPNIDGGSDCVVDVVNSSHIEMYGSYGYDLNLIFYILLSLAGISTVVYIRRKYENIRH